MRVLTAGTFDLFHAGHVKFLERCARLGPVTVAVNTDEFVERYKGVTPVCTYQERSYVLAACTHVHSVIRFNDNMEELLRNPHYAILAIGTDWAKKDYYAQIGISQAWLDTRGVELVYLPYTPSPTTTELKARCASRS